MYTAKTARILIGCGPQFIPSIIKKFNKREQPIWTPQLKSSQGKTYWYSKNEVLMLACLWEARSLGLSREYAEKILSLIERQVYVMEFYNKNMNCCLRIDYKLVEDIIKRKAARCNLDF